MNKLILALFLSLSLLSAYGKYGNFMGYGGYGGYFPLKGLTGIFGGLGANDTNSTASDNKDAEPSDLGAGSSGKVGCSSAILNVNKAIADLVDDIKVQVNLWLVFSDLDTIDESSSYLTSNCDTDDLKVISQAGKSVGSLACQALAEFVQSIVNQTESQTFAAAYGSFGVFGPGNDLSEKALKLGVGLEDNCKIRVVKTQGQGQTAQAQPATEAETEDSTEGTPALDLSVVDQGLQVGGKYADSQMKNQKKHLDKARKNGKAHEKDSKAVRDAEVKKYLGNPPSDEFNQKTQIKSQKNAVNSKQDSQSGDLVDQALQYGQTYGGAYGGAYAGAFGSPADEVKIQQKQYEKAKKNQKAFEHQAQAAGGAAIKKYLGVPPNEEFSQKTQTKSQDSQSGDLVDQALQYGQKYGGAYAGVFGSPADEIKIQQKQAEKARKNQKAFEHQAKATGDAEVKKYLGVPPSDDEFSKKAQAKSQKDAVNNNKDTQAQTSTEAQTQGDFVDQALQYGQNFGGAYTEGIAGVYGGAYAGAFGSPADEMKIQQKQYEKAQKNQKAFENQAQAAGGAAIKKYLGVPPNEEFSQKTQTKSQDSQSGDLVDQALQHGQKYGGAYAGVFGSPSDEIKTQKKQAEKARKNQKAFEHQAKAAGDAEVKKYLGVPPEDEFTQEKGEKTVSKDQKSQAKDQDNKMTAEYKNFGEQFKKQAEKYMKQYANNQDKDQKKGGNQSDSKKSDKTDKDSSDKPADSTEQGGADYASSWKQWQDEAMKIAQDAQKTNQKGKDSQQSDQKKEAKGQEEKGKSKGKKGKKEPANDAYFFGEESFFTEEEQTFAYMFAKASKNTQDDGSNSAGTTNPNFPYFGGFGQGSKGSFGPYFDPSDYAGFIPHN